MKAIKYWCLFLILGVFAGCESLEDTYGDYAEGGALRYLGKCRALTVKPGWKRLIVTWENHVDPVIEKVKVSWALDGVVRDTLFPKGTTSCSITGLENGTYEISVCSVDKEGNTSLPVLQYMRPYTADHENVMSFTRLVNKHFFVKDRLALVFGEWSEDIETATLNYSSNGKQCSKVLDSAFIVDNPYYLLEEPVDAGSKVTVERSGYLEGCTDLIVFEPYELARHRVYTPDFKALVREKYGQVEVEEQFVSTLETLEVDYNIASLEDILNMPALQKLILGKNRYLNPSYLYLYESDSKLTDIDISIFALEVAAEVYGLKVERYNNHYFPEDEFDFMEEMGNPELPELNYLKPAGWEYSYIGEEEDVDISVLFDEESTSGWNSSSTEEQLNHEIVVDLQQTASVQGVVIHQHTNKLYNSYIPQKIQIKVSVDGENWTDATHVLENTLGATRGEIAMVKFPTMQKARFVKFGLTDRANASGTSFRSCLGKIKLF